MVERGRPQITVRRMRFACWIPKATNTYSDYVILFFHWERGATVVKVLCYKSEGRWFDPS